jgi:hypothetical protein
VPYADRATASRFGGRATGNFAGSREDRGGIAGRQSFARMPQQRFGSQGFEQRGWTGNHSVFGGYHNGAMARGESDRGFGSMGAGRIGGGGFHGGGGGFHGGGGRR